MVVLHLIIHKQEGFALVASRKRGRAICIGRYRRAIASCFDNVLDGEA